MSTYIVQNTNDSGSKSLREGIKFANKYSGSTIIFDSNADGEIELKSCLPKLCKPTTIIGNLNSNGIPLNTINGKCKYQIFQIYKTKNCIIKNLCLICSQSSGLYIYKSNSNKIDNCWFGISTKNKKKSNEYGIIINESKFNKIGSNPDSIQNYFSNVISGNKKCGILIIDSEYNNIENNIIGLSSECTDIIENCIGIYLKNSKYNTIGGKKFIDDQGNINNPTGDKGTVTPVFVRPLEGNIISGNKHDGILFECSDNNNIMGNFIGTDNTGLLNFGNGKNGIHFLKSNTNNVSGCGVDSNPFIYYNVVGWNKEQGILIHDSNYNTIQGNFLGTGSNNNNAIPNINGLKISGSSKEIVVGGIIPLGNVIAGNDSNGIYLTDNVKNIQSVNSFLGLKAFGDALPNKLNGILIDSNVSNIKLNTNVISGNNCNGIHIKGKANDIVILNNIIGLTTQGNNALPNHSNGIRISENAHNILIGEEIVSVILYQTICANDEYGILLEDNVNNVIIGNSAIGLTLSRIDYLTNGKGGILLKDKVHDCEFGNSTKFLYVYDKNNFAIKLNECTYNNIITYTFINTNILQTPSIHKKNIINLSDKNHVWGNALPVL